MEDSKQDWILAASPHSKPEDKSSVWLNGSLTHTSATSFVTAAGRVGRREVWEP